MTVVDDISPSVELAPITEDTLHPLVMLAAGGVLSATSLELEGDMDYETFEAIGTMLGGFDRACRWWVGDWLLYGEGAFPADRYAQAAALTGLSEQTLLNRVTMSRAIPPSRRNPRVSYSAHRHVSALPPAQQKSWLSYAEENRSTERELHAAIKLAKGSKQDDGTTRAGSSDDTHEDAELRGAVQAMIANANVMSSRVIVRVDDYRAVVAALGEEEE